LSLSLGWNFKSPLELREVKERRREGPPQFGCGESWWIMEEREERGVKVRIFSLFGPRVEVGRHRSDRWWARSDRWPPLVEPVSPYRFFWPSLGRNDDFEKFNREILSVELTYPRKFWSFSSFLRFCSLNLLQIYYRTFCIHLGHRKRIMWLQGHHRSDRWCAPVRPVLPWENGFEL
jgi:hypothetical protein